MAVGTGKVFVGKKVATKRAELSRGTVAVLVSRLPAAGRGRVKEAVVGDAVATRSRVRRMSPR